MRGTYASFGDRLHHVRGNHDAMLDPTLALEGAPYAIEVGGATLAVVDTVRPTAAGGRITRDQLGWLDETAAATSGPVLVFGHHQIWDLHAAERSNDYFGIDPDSSEAFAAVVARRENIVGYFCGHTHRHRIRRFPEARDVPFVEVGAVKEYMGVWAEYRIHADGYTQIVHRLRAPEAMDWSERTRHLYGGIYPEYARGPSTTAASPTPRGPSTTAASRTPSDRIGATTRVLRAEWARGRGQSVSGP